MAKLGTLAKMVAASKLNNIADDFVNDLIYTIEAEDRDSIGVPSKSFKPSGISGCIRSLYYQLVGAKVDEVSSGVNLIGICESGTDRHERIQNYVQQMEKHNVDCKWLDVGEYLKKNKIKDPQVIEKVGNETKLYSKKYNMRFMCDGLIQYKGELYILEIKTESTYKHNKHTTAWPEHIMQATCYSMTLNVPNVLFLYEDRNTCSKKGYLVTVTPQRVKFVENKIDTVNKHLKSNTVPPRELDKCMYCNYKDQCRKDGE